MLYVLAAIIYEFDASESSCALDEMYTCTVYNVTQKNTFVTKDKTLCNGKCRSSKTCSGIWSEWSTIPDDPLSLPNIGKSILSI